MRERLRRALPGRRPEPRPFGLPAHLRMPPDLADVVALRAYLADWSIFGNAQEAEGYLNDAFERFRVTMAMVRAVPPGARVLELGANPYFLTRLLRRSGYEVECANYFGPHVEEGPGVQEAPRVSDGTVERFEFQHFNIETGPFPYADGSFDLVLFCEILEHLPFDPVNPLGEIHRVLKPGSGQVLITTPNAIRAGNVARIFRGENVYESLSGYGPYGRHNREYTLAELRRLLTENGFVVTDAFTADVHAHDEHNLPAAAGISPDDRADNLFCLARAEGPSRWRYPDWLFTSKHGLYARRMVAASVVMGVNDDLQASGLHPLEHGEGVPFRWMGSEPARFLTQKRYAGPGSLVVEGFTPPIAAGALPRLTARLNGTVAEWAPSEAGPFRAALALDAPAGRQEVELEVSSTWCPAEAGVGADERRIGLGLTRVSWAEDAAAG